LDVKTESLNYELPSELIAQQPCGIRSDSRLLVLSRSTKELLDSRFSKIGDFLSAGDCLVLNDTKVLQARFFARRGTGGKLEGLFLKESGAGVWEVLLRGGGKVRAGETISLRTIEKRDFGQAQVLEKLGGGGYRLKIEAGEETESILERIGFPPLPPYIRRGDDLSVAASDRTRYQTVYARKTGAVAAPTAGLHFTDELIEQLKGAGVHFAYLTLHVGPGTFRPITTEKVEDHQLGQELFSIDEENARLINTAREKGGRIIAVGTTSVRALETMAVGPRVRAGRGETPLFITPGYEFRLIDAMVTNFHLPRSSLLALVGAFAGLETILAAYRHAIEQRYRFYSYGDAMLIV
jgi:S-adenosylmethionine:tRNA ribosyltransferase-isomerase